MRRPWPTRPEFRLRATIHRSSPASLPPGARINRLDPSQKRSVDLSRLLLISEARDVKRASRGLAAWIEGVDLHLERILGEANGDQPRGNRFVLPAANCTCKVRFCFPLEGYLPCDRIGVNAVELAFIDHISPSY